MKRIAKRLALFASLAIVLAACAGSTDDTLADPVPQATQASAPQATEAPAPIDTEPEMMDGVDGLPAVDPLDVTGDIVAAGSSTVFPLAEAMLARFEDEGYGGNMTIDSIGSGGGFERFCESGETDISNASRPIKDSEVAACEEIGRTPIEIRVGTDALAVTVSPTNYFVENLSLEELALAFSTAETWADVNPDFPAHPILRFSPGTDSGTFDYFVEEVFDEDEAPILGAGNLQLSEDDNVLVQGVSGDGCTEGDPSTPCAIGYFGFAYYVENADVLSVLSIEGVAANAETVDANEYPLARPLFMYTTAGIMQEKPQVAAFVNFVLSYVNEEIGDVGYFPASDADLHAARQAWLDAQG